MMDKELEQYYNTYRELFMNAGWKQLQEDLKQNALVINSVEATKDSNDLYFRKGQLSILANITQLRSSNRSS